MRASFLIDSESEIYHLRAITLPDPGWPIIIITSLPCQSCLDNLPTTTASSRLFVLDI